MLFSCIYQKNVLYLHPQNDNNRINFTASSCADYTIHIT